ncbi:hypothetical protein I79_021726 [Cricetulus griseus]|uniref:Uncharacterized protein n=1 Tax=Cricetulus griseus TaxID=10029 RepID=G3IDE8_CRIGR|nr:hypothetical protein I79_021726 [Cricetulus griseus]
MGDTEPKLAAILQLGKAPSSWTGTSTQTENLRLTICPSCKTCWGNGDRELTKH